MSSDGLILSSEPELLRVNQKDEEYSFTLYQRVIDALEIFVPKVMSYRMIQSNQDFLKILSVLSYYAMTTLSNRKTLGEEFSNLAQFNRRDFDYLGVPTSFKRRTFFFILATLSPYILKKMLQSRFDNMRNLILASSREDNTTLLASIIRNIPNYDGIVDKIMKVHLCAFFLDGLYVMLSKRITSIRYVFQRKQQDHNITYTKVGKVMAIQLIIEFIRFIYHVYSDYQTSISLKSQQHTYQYQEDKHESTREQDKDAQVPQELLCTLCYDRRVQSSCTPCGHLFCWDCIIKSTQIKPECPNCRAPCKPQKITQLANFI